MKNSGASSSDPKGKRPTTQDELESLEKVAKESDRIKRIKQEAELKGISYEDCKIIVNIEETDLVEKQHTEDELLAKALAQQLEEDEADIIKRQIKDNEMLAIVLAQQEESELPRREEFNFFSTPSNPQKEEEEYDEDPSIQPLTRRKRDVAGRSNMQGSSSDKTPDS